MKKIFHMATMPSRVSALNDSIPSILQQCDELHVYLNGFNEVPSIFKHDKIKLYLSKDLYGDLGDVGKFYNCHQWNSDYHFTVDDKIIYPPDYVEKSIEAIERYEGKALITYHGRVLHTDRPSISYYKDFKEMIPLIGGTPIDRQLHVGGTGVMSFKGGCIPTFDLAVFKYINMTDVWLSLWAGMLKIPIIRPKSRDRWIGISKKFDSNHSISALISDEIHTEAINNVKWNNI